MIPYRFTPKFLRRKLHFPLSQWSRIVEDRPKHDIDNKRFKTMVNQVLKPLLANKGFIGQDYFYYRKTNQAIDTILLGTSPYGKAICLNVEVKKHSHSSIKLTENEIDQLESISPNPPGGHRLTPDANDCWWWFRPTEAENYKVIMEIYVLIMEEGEPYFRKFRT